MGIRLRESERGRTSAAAEQALVGRVDDAVDLELLQMVDRTVEQSATVVSGRERRSAR